VARSATDTAARKTNRPINRGRLRKVDRGLDFFFIARISDQWMNLVSFKNARQQVSTVHNVVATALCGRANGRVKPPERLDTARRLQASLFRRAHHYGLGRGCGVGRTLGIGLGLGVGVGRGVEVAVAVGVAVGVGLGGGVTVAVGVAVAVAVGVGVAVAVAVGVDVGVDVGVGDGVGTPPGAWTITLIGEPVLKKPTVAFVGFGPWSESNRKLYSVPKRMALAFAFCAIVSQFQVIDVLPGW